MRYISLVFLQLVAAKARSMVHPKKRRAKLTVLATMLLSSSIAVPAYAAQPDPCSVVPADPRCAFVSELMPDYTQALLDTADDQAAITSTPAPPNEDDGAPMPDVAQNPPDDPPPTGLQQDDQAPEPAAVFMPTNGWIGKVGENYIHVWAGASGVDSKIPMIEIATLDARGDNILETKLLTGPSRSGPLRITSSITGAQLNISAADGSLFSYTLNADHLLPR